MNGGKKVAGSLIVARGDRPELFDFAEEVLDQVALLVKVPVECTRVDAVALGRNNGGLARRSQRVEDALVGIETFIGDQRVCLHAGQQVVGPDQIVRFASGQQESERIAESVDQSVDLRAQSAARAPDGLVRAIFF